MSLLIVGAVFLITGLAALIVARRAIIRADRELDEALYLYGKMRELAHEIDAQIERRDQDIAPDFPVTVGEENKL